MAAAGDRRWAWADVDLDAIARNVGTLKGLLKPGTLFMAVVKADGYGHGALEVARTAIAAGADRLGVATVEEALRLRAGGVTAPIHMLSEAPPASAGLLVERDVTPALFEDFLPYAIALDCENQWSKKFELATAVPDGAAADHRYYVPMWYQGDAFRELGAGGFASAIGISLGSAAASASSAPGSGSGGGGGFSGGGGGGGGGGGW